MADPVRHTFQPWMGMVAGAILFAAAGSSQKDAAFVVRWLGIALFFSSLWLRDRRYESTGDFGDIVVEWRRFRNGKRAAFAWFLLTLVLVVEVNRWWATGHPVLGTTVFVLGWAIALLELLATWRMSDWTFRYAIPVRMSFRFPAPRQVDPDGPIQAPHLLVVRVARGHWRFRRFGPVAHTVLAVRGVVTLKGGEVIIEGRRQWGGFLCVAGAGLALPLWAGLPLALLAAALFVYVEGRRFQEDCREVARALGQRIF